jgi:hypothetical protein
MAADATNLVVLSTRAGFNSAVRHIKKTISIMEAGSKENVADILYEDDDEEMAGNRAGIVLGTLLVDKLGYKTASANLRSTVGDPSSLAKEFEKWKGVDLVVTYQHPELGLLVANPKVAEELASFGDLRKNELIVVYAGKGDEPADDTCKKAAELALSLFEGSKAKAPAAFTKGGFTAKKIKKAKAAPEPKAKTPKAAKAPKAAKKGRAAPARGRAAAAPAAAPPPEAQRVAPPVVTAAAPPVSAPTGPVKMTPRYAVVVQNELFHNGNVEAWKKIVASYNAKYPQLQVYIYYDGERILDINSLFKWGKVKHGSAIEFAVAGNEIKDVAKLQRYLAQGASHQFEAFLHGPVNSVLKLF